MDKLTVGMFIVLFWLVLGGVFISLDLPTTFKVNLPSEVQSKENDSGIVGRYLGFLWDIMLFRITGLPLLIGIFIDFMAFSSLLVGYLMIRGD